MVEHKLGGVPHFCVTIRHDENREKVQIPVELLEFMPKGLSGSAVLRGLSSRHWTVKLSLEAYRLFITEGWDRFFEENALCKDDFLVFGHCGGGETEKFDVRIFDKHGRERLDVSDAVGLSATNQEIKKEDTSVAFGGKEKGCKYSENNTLSGLQGENLGDGLPPGTSVHTRSVRNRDGPAKIGENLSIGLKPETSCKRKRDGPAESGVATMSLDRNDTTEVAMSAWYCHGLNLWHSAPAIPSLSAFLLNSICKNII